MIHVSLSLKYGWLNLILCVRNAYITTIKESLMALLFVAEEKQKERRKQEQQPPFQVNLS